MTSSSGLLPSYLLKMSQDAPTAPAEVVEVSNATNGEAGGSVTNSSATVAPVASPSAPTPSGVVEEKPKAEVPLAERLKVSMDLPVSTSTSKKERPKVVLAAWQPDEGVSECLHCKRSFNPLFLRFKVRLTLGLGDSRPADFRR